VRSALRHLAAILGSVEPDERYLLELAVVLVLIAVVAVLALVFVGDAVADLITLVGGRVDEQLLDHSSLAPSSAPKAP
jgi:hypothetical protein